jgi:dienelactone hydrolase
MKAPVKTERSTLLRAWLRRAAALAAFLALALSTHARDDRENLLVIQDENGATHPVKTAADWQRRRAQILANAQSVMGPLPGADKRVPTDMQVTAEADAGSYVRRTITYAGEPGSRVPAMLLVPKTASPDKPAPAVLALHQTDFANAHRSVCGLGGRASMFYGAELAERGFIVLAPCYPTFPDRTDDPAKLGYASGTMKAIWDNMRGLDLLESLPFVRRGGFGAIGHSLGGHNAIFTAAFDDRIHAVATSCGFDSFTDYKGGDITGWTSHRYMPRLLDYKDRLADVPFDFPELLAAIAPRAVFISAPLGDDNFKWQSAARCAAAARKVFDLLGAGPAIVIEHPDAPHDFPDAMRKKAYDHLADAARKNRR